MGKNVYLTEAQLNELIKEMAYPAGFNMQEMLSLPSYAKRLQYCQLRLRKLGSGSSRVVFAVDDEKVLKVAKNQKGLAQNQEESQGWKQSYDIFAKVYEASDDGVFLEMQFARKAKKSDFKRLTGYDFDVMCAWIRYTVSQYSRRPMYGTSQYSELFDSEEWSDGIDNYNIFAMVYSYLCDTCLESFGDMTRLSSWGVVTENGEEKLVLIDFGLSDEVFADFYSYKRPKRY